MVQASDFFTHRMQISLFTAKSTPISPYLLIASTVSLPSKRYSGRIQSVPVDAPCFDAIPLVEINSPDHAWTVAAARHRVDSRWNHPVADAIPDAASCDDVLTACLEPLISYLNSAQDTVVGRLALIVYRSARVPEPAQALVSRFCDVGAKDQSSVAAPFRNSKGFQIHNHKQYQLPGTSLIVNSWVRCKSATMATNNEPVILVEQDVNTLAEATETSQFSIDELERFCRSSLSETNGVLDLYFPPGV